MTLVDEWGEFDPDDLREGFHLDWFDDIEDGWEYEPYCELENPESCESCQ